ncbi:MAG: hypothetical protein GY842_07250 [bacterium]|nr:hypothetical protein [bacterium]
MNTLRITRYLSLVALMFSTGCSHTAVDLDDASTREQLSLLMPATVSIVAPFTRFASFDENDRPDGIELLLQPTNSFGEPVNIAGALIVELYEFRQASGEARGAKLQQWDIALRCERDQQMYWNRTTDMYEFQLQFDPAALPSNHKYVLEVTYNTPLHEHMVDQYVMDVPLAMRALAESKPSGG